MINGRTELIAHLGYSTETFTAPMIYNPWFASRGINAVVVPMGVRAEDYAAFLRPLFRLSNIRGAGWPGCRICRRRGGQVMKKRCDAVSKGAPVRAVTRCSVAVVPEAE